MKIACKNRINLDFKNSKLLLDPKKMNVEANCFFISHAHYDHLPTTKAKPRGDIPIVSSEATAALFKERKGFAIRTTTSWENDDFSIEAIPNGHTFDSTAALIKDKATDETILYTGDINNEDRGYLQGFQARKCDVLIVEATYGKSGYQFPPFNEQITLAKEYIQNELANGHPIAILGYSVGKAQLLNYCLGNLAEKRFSRKSIWEMEQIHLKLGLRLHKTKLFSKQMIDQPILEEEPWLLFYTGSGRKDAILQELKKKYGLRVIACSGWARDNYYKYRIGADQAYIISDHCDYSSLFAIIEKCQPKKIFTIYGSAKELAKDLQKEGFNAIPLVEGQACLDHFL